LFDIVGCRAGIISVVEEESPPPPPKYDDRDQFYIGNDEFYLPKELPSIKVRSVEDMETSENICKGNSSLL
jgi:hypothetical protein